MTTFLKHHTIVTRQLRLLRQNGLAVRVLFLPYLSDNRSHFPDIT